jgi:hypothetical protein
MALTLSILPDKLAICRLPPDANVPIWASRGGTILSITKTTDELSIVCPEAGVPEGVRADRGWRCFKIEGPLDLSLTGVLASLVNPLAEARINIFALSTFDTDYLLVKEDKVSKAAEILIQAGHRLSTA